MRTIHLDGVPGRAIGFLLNLFVFLTVPLFGHPGVCHITLLAPTMFVDPTCNKCSGNVEVQLRNDGSKTVKLELTFGDLIDKNTHNPLNAKFAPPVALNGPNGEPAPQKKNIEPGENVFVRITLWNLLEEGESQADLYNRGSKIGTLKVVKYHLPLGLKFNVANPDDPELFVRRNRLTSFSLRNDDSTSYPLSWELVVNGVSGLMSGRSQPSSTSQTASGSTKTKKPPPCAVGPPATGKFTIPAKGAVNEIFCPPDDWFEDPLEGAFRDETTDGQLVLRLLPLATPPGEDPTMATPTTPMGQTTTLPTPDTPAKLIKVKVHLAYVQPQVQFIMILGVLFLGALTSLFLNGYVPNQIRRVRMTRTLNSLGQRIRELPMSLASRIRVTIGLERARLQTQLRETWGGTTGFSTVVSEAKQGIGDLERRLKLAESFGELRVHFNNLRLHSFVPTLISRIEAKFENVIELLRISQFDEDDAQAAKKHITEIEVLLASLDNLGKLQREEPDFLSDRVAWLHERARSLREGKVPLKLAEEQIIKLDDTIAGIEERHRGAPFTDQEFQEVDMALSKANLIVKASSEDAPTRMGELLELISSSNYEDFEAATRLVDEIREGIFPEHLGDELKKESTIQGIPILHQVSPGLLQQVQQAIRAVGVFFFMLAGVMTIVMLVRWIAQLDQTVRSYVGAVVTVSLVGMSFLFISLLTRLAGPLLWVLDKVRPKILSVPVASEKHVRIDQVSSEVRVYQATPLRIWFEAERYNSSAARGDIVPHWDFHHDHLTEERGWEVEHYFPRPDNYLVTVTFTNRDGGAIVFGSESERLHVVKTLTVRPREGGAERGVFWLGITRLLIALVPAMLVLYAGAAEKLQKFDLFTALIGIFLLGFTSDQLKNLLADQPES